MKDAREEKYVFYNLAKQDFYEAAGCLDAIKQYERGLTKTTMMKNAIIAYSRPFKTCRGKYGQYSLPIEVIPKNYRYLHDKILYYRDCIIAHTDLNVRNPKLVKYGIMMKKVGDYLILVGEMPVLIREVLNAVHNMILKYGEKVH